MLKQISDNRDTEIIDYLDNAGAPRNMLNELPKFDRLNIWTYTCISLLLKSLASGDKKEVERLQMNYRIPNYFKNLDGTVHSLERAEFAVELLDICHSVCSGNTQYDSHVVWIESQIDLKPEMMISGYKDIHLIQWQIEKLRWVSAGFSYMYLMQNSKSRKALYSSFSATLSTLKNVSMNLKNSISSAIFSSVDDMNSVDLMLHSNWEKSVQAFTRILKISCADLDSYGHNYS